MALALASLLELLEEEEDSASPIAAAKEEELQRVAAEEEEEEDLHMKTSHIQTGEENSCERAMLK